MRDLSALLVEFGAANRAFGPKEAQTGKAPMAPGYYIEMEPIGKGVFVHLTTPRGRGGWLASFLREKGAVVVQPASSRGDHFSVEVAPTLKEPGFFSMFESAWA